MSPNAPQNYSNPSMPMMSYNVRQSSAFADVSVDRIWEIARHMAQLEISQESLVDSCVSLLDSTPDLMTRRYGSLAGPSPPPPMTTTHSGHKMEKSYCEVVSVPTSTHVAQIVGKQGMTIYDHAQEEDGHLTQDETSATSCRQSSDNFFAIGSKIKLLRAKSRTYIQTPVSGEEPVFIITGRREDVLKVKSEILSASEHFSCISEERRQKFRQNCNVPGMTNLDVVIDGELLS